LTGRTYRQKLSVSESGYRWRAVQLVLGHTKLESTVRYVGMVSNDVLEIAEYGCLIQANGILEASAFGRWQADALAILR